jgi:hypothetical protein
MLHTFNTSPFKSRLKKKVHAYATSDAATTLWSRDIVTPSVESLIIDHAAVRRCPNGFFENVSPLISLASFSNLHRIVASQMAFIYIDTQSPLG